MKTTVGITGKKLPMMPSITHKAASDLYRYLLNIGR